MLKASSLFLLLLLTTSLLVGASCGTPTQTSGDLVAPPQIPPVTLVAEDIVEVRVYREEELSGTFRISPEGVFVYPLLGTVVAEGKTVAELMELLRAGLADGYLVNPQVQVEVKVFNARMVSVIGQVARPGRYSYRDGFSLVQAIAEAGGTTDSAVLGMMQVTRTLEHGKRFHVSFKDITEGRTPDFLLVPGDIIVVAESAVK